jgi:hypothetical protein
MFFAGKIFISTNFMLKKIFSILILHAFNHLLLKYAYLFDIVLIHREKIVEAI